jgi:hypothetical protein
MQQVKGMPLVDFECLVARKYRDKVTSSKTRNIEFKLTLGEFRQLLMRKNCAYTGIPLTLHVQGNQTHTYLSIERVDNSKGYVKGNVISVCHAANNIKSVFEDPNTFLSVKDAVMMFASISKMQNNL